MHSYGKQGAVRLLTLILYPDARPRLKRVDVILARQSQGVGLQEVLSRLDDQPAVHLDLRTGKHSDKSRRTPFSLWRCAKTSLTAWLVLLPFTIIALRVSSICTQRELQC